MAYFLGVDTSTTSSKALVIDDGGEVIEVGGLGVVPQDLPVGRN